MNTKIKILHLEDSLKDSELIHSIIESGAIGHEYFLADNEKDFNNILETENIDIILSDYSLPDYNGNEALKLAREKYSFIPFIFVSGKIGEDAAIDTMLNGATDYVFKTKLERLVPAIKRALHENELEIQRKRSEINLKEKNELIEAQNKQLIESLKNIKEINDELINAMVKAQESDNLKSAFLANMNHEIRTPLNAIMGFSELLLQTGLSKEKIENFVQIIHVSSLQLLSIISDIMDISKIESGQIIIGSDMINVNNLLNELFITYKKIVDLEKIKFSWTCDRPDDVIQIKTDGNRIKQVLCNLLNNAIKFTEEGEINFGFNIKEHFVEFFVKDTGIGISQENHLLIFDHFRQVDLTSTRIYGGNGLGLSISKALVEKLGGTITVHSELGTGSTFSFTIPYIKETEETVGSASMTKSDQPIFKNGKTILIVEDEVNNHAYLEELLSEINVKAVHAWDGKEAVEQVKKHSEISLVLMDIKMPVMDGNEATRLIKHIRPELPIIAQTAFTSSHDKKLALEAGFDNYISKPISKETLLKLIADYLN